MYPKIVITFCVILSAIPLFSQKSEGGIPYSWQNNIAYSPEKALVLPGKSAITQASRETKTGKELPLTFAEVFRVNAGMDTSGEWSGLPNGDKLWQLHIKSEGAYSLNVIFSYFLIPEGASVFIYNAEHTQVIGAFTYKNISDWLGLATSPVAGNELIIEYFEPAEAGFHGELVIESVGHDYLGVFGNKDGQFGASGDCNVDINCDAGDDWQVQKRAVCRMVSNGSQLCTGALVNNTLEDQTPYILSANHCVSTQSTAQKTVFVFNYESPGCNGTDGSVSKSLSGADLVATKNIDAEVLGYLDFTLLRLKETVPLSYQPYFAGWDSRPNIPPAATCIHHPWGDVKKISVENNALEKDSYVGYGYDPQSFLKVLQWDLGTTEGGSSGSPLFDASKRIVGTLTGGDADCDLPVNDYFQMVSVAYDKYSGDSMQLRHWLDPDQSGIEFLDGYDPLYNNREITDLTSIVHWKEGQMLAFYKANEGGYLAGNNIYQDRAKAEFYNKQEFSPLDVVTGAYVAFGYASGRDNELVEMQVLKDNFGIPSTVLGSAYVTLGEIKEKADKNYVYFNFDPPVEVNSSIYLSIVLPQYDGDTVAIMTVEESEENTGWELNYENNWYPYSDPDFSWNIKLSHLIAMEIGRYASVGSGPEVENALVIFPNPANSEITIENGIIDMEQVDILDNLGRLILSDRYQKDTKSVTLPVSGLLPGVYYVRVINQNQIATSRFIRQ
jgi:hypothetical protein